MFNVGEFVKTTLTYVTNLFRVFAILIGYTLTFRLHRGVRICAARSARDKAAWPDGRVALFAACYVAAFILAKQNPTYSSSSWMLLQQLAGVNEVDKAVLFCAIATYLVIELLLTVATRRERLRRRKRGRIMAVVRYVLACVVLAQCAAVTLVVAVLLPLTSTVNASAQARAPDLVSSWTAIVSPFLLIGLVTSAGLIGLAAARAETRRAWTFDDVRLDGAPRMAAQGEQVVNVVLATPMVTGIALLAAATLYNRLAPVDYPQLINFACTFDGQAVRASGEASNQTARFWELRKERVATGIYAQDDVSTYVQHSDLSQYDFRLNISYFEVDGRRVDNLLSAPKSSVRFSAVTIISPKWRFPWEGTSCELHGRGSLPQLPWHPSEGANHANIQLTSPPPAPKG